MEKESFDDFIREIKQKNDLVSVASRYVQVDRKGRYYWCRCPFHGEKTASLCINDIDNFFYCFGCHTGGDVITFMMRIESMTYIEAVKKLAEMANIEIPESFAGGGGEDIAKAKKRKDRLLSLMKEVAKHYHENLSKPSAKLALEYMDKRKLTGNTATKFGLGYSDGYTEIASYLVKLGYSVEEMISAGVLKKKNDRIYDPLANRLIFPIIDIYGNVIAFGGRTLDPHPEFAKYLNTSDTELFNKKNTLYAINYLKKQRQLGPIPFIIVVEGYMDTISLHKAGFTMTIASMGTALTKEQASMIKRFADKVYICYDGDAPGQMATIRGLDILKDNGLDVMVVQLPDGYDPDDVIKAYGREGYQKILDKSLPLVEFKIKYLKNKYNLGSVDGRAKYLNDAIDILAKVSNSVERELYIPMVGEISQTNVNFIKLELEKKLSGELTGDEGVISVEKALTKSDNLSEIEKDSEDESNPAVIKAEKYVLYSLIHQKPYAIFKTDIEYLFSGKRKRIFKTIIENSKKYFGSDLLQAVFDQYGENGSEIADIINYGAESAENPENEKKYYTDCLKVMNKSYLENSLEDLSKQFAVQVDNIKRRELSVKMKEILMKIKNNNVGDL